jgi:hypothetical protein
MLCLRTRRAPIAAHGEISISVLTGAPGAATSHLDSVDHVCALASRGETTRPLARFLLATEIVQI